MYMQNTVNIGACATGGTIWGQAWNPGAMQDFDPAESVIVAPILKEEAFSIEYESRRMIHKLINIEVPEDIRFIWKAPHSIRHDTNTVLYDDESVSYEQGVDYTILGDWLMLKFEPTWPLEFAYYPLVSYSYNDYPNNDYPNTYTYPVYQPQVWGTNQIIGITPNQMIGTSTGGYSVPLTGPIYTTNSGTIYTNQAINNMSATTTSVNMAPGNYTVTTMDSYLASKSTTSGE